MKKVIVVTTGGSIAFKRNTATGALIPVDGEDTIAQLTNSGIVVEFSEFSSLPGSHFTPVQGLELARQIESFLQNDDVAGVVVTHGTDTLEETAYLLDLTIRHEKPVVVTGAARPPAMPGYDGLHNLACAVQVAAAAETRETGVLVVFAGQIFAAGDIQKTHAHAVEAFAAPGSGPLGWIVADRIWMRHRLVQRVYIPCTRLEERVDLITPGQGSDDRLLRHAIADRVAGIVIEAFGSGRVPPWWLPAIQEAIAQRIMVVIATRAGDGALYDEYGYVGAYHDLERLGTFFAHHLNGRKARIRLMLALGAVRRPEDARVWFS
ncbi:asparaginase [Roseiflexus sp.]|uniref:asparaginase n=1 Tax=Roseiflexus sp. TaxID=2562120 RepID=UPI00398AF024